MLQVFDGTYTQYREYLENQQAKQAARLVLTQEAVPKKSRAAPTSPEEKQRRLRLKAVEERIAHLEGEIAILARKLETPPADLAKFSAWSRITPITRMSSTSYVGIGQLHREASQVSDVA
jgi:hypothetical protein